MHGLSIQKVTGLAQGRYLPTVKITALVAVIIFLFLSPSARAETAIATFDEMSLRARVGQVFIWTYSGTSFLPQSQVALEKYQPGALIVFGRNIQSPAQIARVNVDTQSFAVHKFKIPFFLMIDQEGGTVTRLRTAVPTPSALALGKMDDPAFIQSFGKAQGELLRSVGFNVNLAPVLDITNPNMDSFIGNRAFGDDPEKVATMAVAYAEGIHDGGLLPTAKHFPGHGGVIQDSHKTMPSKLATYTELADRDLVPFEEYAHAEFPKALMMAHMALPKIDPSGVPSTYSRVLIQDYLRTKLKYDGLVITDDLEMSGASIHKDIGERAVRAFLAGNDMLMMAGPPAHQRRAFEAVYLAVKSGRISPARLKESVSRILAYKNELKLGTFTYDEKAVNAAILKVNDLSRGVLKHNFELSLHGKTSAWPEITRETRTLVLSSDPRFYDSFKSTFNGESKFYQLTPHSLAHAAADVDEYKLLVFYASGAQTAHYLASLSPDVRKKTIVVNTNNPGEVDAQSGFLSVLNVNSYNPECGAGLATALSTPAVRTPSSAPATEK